MVERGSIRLRPDYELRGWQKLPWALVRRSGGKPVFMAREAFRACQLCDGRPTSEAFR